MYTHTDAVSAEPHGTWNKRTAGVKNYRRGYCCVLYNPFFCSRTAMRRAMSSFVACSFLIWTRKRQHTHARFPYTWLGIAFAPLNQPNLTVS